MNRWSKLALALLVLVGTAVLASCSDGGRPGVASWAAEWEALTSTVPELAQFGSPPDRELCGHVLGQIRQGRADAVPTPDLALDPVVEEWFTIAEDAMFECPPSSSQFPDFEFAYQELARLEAEVEAVLALAAQDG